MLTTNPIVNNDQDNRIMVNVILKYLPIALFLGPGEKAEWRNSRMEE